MRQQPSHWQQQQTFTKQQKYNFNAKKPKNLEIANNQKKKTNSFEIQRTNWMCVCVCVWRPKTASRSGLFHTGQTKQKEKCQQKKNVIKFFGIKNQVK